MMAAIKTNNITQNKSLTYLCLYIEQTIFQAILLIMPSQISWQNNLHLVSKGGYKVVKRAFVKTLRFNGKIGLK